MKVKIMKDNITYKTYDTNDYAEKLPKKYKKFNFNKPKSKLKGFISGKSAYEYQLEEELGLYTQENNNSKLKSKIEEPSDDLYKDLEEEFKDDISATEEVMTNETTVENEISDNKSDEINVEDSSDNISDTEDEDIELQNWEKELKIINENNNKEFSNNIKDIIENNFIPNNNDDNESENDF